MDLECDDFIEKTKREPPGNDATDDSDQTSTLVRFLKVLVMVSSRIKLMSPLLSKHRTIKERLDKNCSPLMRCLCDLFQLLTRTGLASKEKAFDLLPHFFPAYCCIFQGFLLQFLFTSGEILASADKNVPGTGCALRFNSESSECRVTSSLNRTASRLDKFDYVADRITFSIFMTDIFESLRTLVNPNRRINDKNAVRVTEEYSPGQPTNNLLAPLYSDVLSESQEIPSSFSVDDMVD